MAYRVSSVKQWVYKLSQDFQFGEYYYSRPKNAREIRERRFILKMYQMLYVHTNRENFKTELLAVAWIGA